jgi:hypothetical protein
MSCQLGSGISRSEEGAGLGKSIWYSWSSSSVSGRGQRRPAALARRTYSLTVVGDIEQLQAIARLLSPLSHLRRRTSWILHTDNLSWGIGHLLCDQKDEDARTIRDYPVPLSCSQAIMPEEEVSTMVRNQCPACVGICNGNTQNEDTVCLKHPGYL